MNTIEITKRKFLVVNKDIFLYLWIALYIFYTFWFQYSFFEVPGILSISGGVILLLTVIEIRRLRDYSLMLPLFVFLIFLFLISIFNTGTINYTILIMKYLIPCLGTFAYARKSRKHFVRIIGTVFAACLFVAISLIVSGEITYDGALQLNNLNINQASNFFSLGLTFGLLLIDIKKGLDIKNVILIFSMVLLCAAQIMCASRRGFLVMLFLVVTYVFSLLNTIFKKNYYLKIIIIITIVTICFFLLSIYGSNLSALPIFERLSGNNTTGDAARMSYQAVAIQIFKNNPIIGSGLGSVALVLGVYSHSLYFELLACTGIIGFIIIIGYLLFLFFKINKIRIIRKHSQNMDAFYDLFMMIYVLSIFISGIAMVFIYESYFYIMLAIAASYIYEESSLILKR